MEKSITMFKGKAIYNPSGKAGEYSEWAVNFYNGCSGDCSYCYCKKYPMSQFWSTIPTLKKSLVDEETAIKIFEKELGRNLLWEKTEGITNGLKKNGLFFNFSSDPLLDASATLNTKAMQICFDNKVPVKILTKQTSQIEMMVAEMANNGTFWNRDIPKDLLAIGFTLTGHDKLEPGCSPNHERIMRMEDLHALGIKTWASIEPIIDFGASELMVSRTKNFCDHYKIGLESGSKHSPEDIRVFMNKVNFHISFTNQEKIPTIYWKDSLLKAAGVSRDELPSNCIGRGYNLFE